MALAPAAPPGFDPEKADNFADVLRSVLVLVF